jgi:RsiW-degrading membrane proteinase PrsW (M82 family)
MKSISHYWALSIGLLSILAQVVTYFLRFGQLNTQASLGEYVLFFLSGSLGGAILLFFLNRQTRARAWWIVLGTFLLTTPISLLMMLGGGLFGPLGILLLPQIPWALITWIGSLLGGALSRAKA